MPVVVEVSDIVNSKNCREKKRKTMTMMVVVEDEVVFRNWD